MWSVYLLALSLAGLVSAAPPELLNRESFEQNIASGTPYFIKFFAPWCGHCKRLAPTWDELSEKFVHSEVNIAKVDCTVETALCADQGVRGYPTLKLFHSGEEVQYKGSRDLQSLAQFVLEHTSPQQQQQSEEERAEELAPVEEKTSEGEEEGEGEGSALLELTDETFEPYINDHRGIHFVKFYAPWCGHCQRLAPVWDKLADHFASNPSVHIIKVDCTKEKVTCQRHGVRGYPTLLLFEAGLVVERYSGSRTLEDLQAFVGDNILEETEEEEEEEEVRGVVELTGETFQSAIAEGITFVKFYAPWCGHCKRLAPTWDSLALQIHSSHNSVTIAKVDCTAEQGLCSGQGVRGYPTLVLFVRGERAEEYRGAREMETLVEFVTKHSSSSDQGHDPGEL